MIRSRALLLRGRRHCVPHRGSIAPTPWFLGTGPSDSEAGQKRKILSASVLQMRRKKRGAIIERTRPVSAGRTAPLRRCSPNGVVEETGPIGPGGLHADGRLIGNLRDRLALRELTQDRTRPIRQRVMQQGAKLSGQTHGPTSLRIGWRHAIGTVRSTRQPSNNERKSQHAADRSLHPPSIRGEKQQ